MQPLMAFPFYVGGGQAALDKFTGLEGLIGLLQMAGACFNLLKGAKVLQCHCLLYPWCR